MKGIGKRVAIGFMSIVALLFISGMISLFELGNLSNDTENILSASKRNMELAKDMLKSAHDHSRAMMNVAVFDDRTSEDLCRRSMGDLEGLLAAARSEAYNESCLDSLSSTMNELRTLSDGYLLQSNKQSDAEKSSLADFEFDTASFSGKVWYDTKYEMIYLRLLDQIKNFMTLTHSSLAPRAAQLNKNAYRSVAPVFISLIVMIAIVLMFFYFINVYCVRPILKINGSLREYLSFKLPYNVKAELIDELKELDDNIGTLINISKQNKQ